MTDDGKAEVQDNCLLHGRPDFGENNVVDAKSIISMPPKDAIIIGRRDRHLQIVYHYTYSAYLDHPRSSNDEHRDMYQGQMIEIYIKLYTIYVFHTYTSKGYISHARASLGIQNHLNPSLLHLIFIVHLS